MPCLSGSYDPAIGPIIELGIGHPREELLRQSADRSQAFFGVRTLVDTGSASTCVTSATARRIGVLPAGKSWMASTIGSQQCYFYILDLQLPTTGHHGQPAPIRVRDVQVIEIATMSQHFDALLGRDVLDRGLFTLSGHDQRFDFCL